MTPSQPQLQPVTAPSSPVSNWKRNLIGIAISVACIGFIAWRIDLAELRTAIVHFKWPYLFWGVASLALGYAARILRWATLLRAAGASITPQACAAPFLGSIALNNTLPMRVGDVVRAFVFPAAIGVDRTVATGSLVMERLVDLMTLLACLVIGLSLSPTAHLPAWLATTSVTLAIVGAISLTLVFLFSGLLSRWFLRAAGEPASSALPAMAADHQVAPLPGKARIMRTVGDLLASFNAMSRLPVLLALTALSVVVWAGEAGLFLALLRGFGFDAGMETAVIVMAIATLSTLVPSSPGYVGPFHLAAFAAISMLGGSAAQAGSFAVVAHLSVWAPTTLAGAIAILMNPQLFSGAKRKTTITK